MGPVANVHSGLFDRARRTSFTMSSVGSTLLGAMRSRRRSESIHVNQRPWKPTTPTTKPIRHFVNKWRAGVQLSHTEEAPFEANPENPEDTPVGIAPGLWRMRSRRDTETFTDAQIEVRTTPYALSVHDGSRLAVLCGMRVCHPPTCARAPSLPLHGPCSRSGHRENARCHAGRRVGCAPHCFQPAPSLTVLPGRWDCCWTQETYGGQASVITQQLTSTQHNLETLMGRHGHMTSIDDQHRGIFSGWGGVRALCYSQAALRLTGGVCGG
jgi:hypothetical protein